MGRKVGVIENPEIAEEYMIGNTRVRIAVNFCKDKTKEDVDKIMQEIKKIVINDRIKTAALNNKNCTERNHL